MPFGFGGGNNGQQGGAPVVVQGVAVPQGAEGLPSSAYVQQGDPYRASKTDGGYVNDGSFSGKGEKQRPQFNDVAFSIVFVLHLVVMAFFAAAYGSGGNMYGGGQQNGGGTSVAVPSIIGLVGVCGLFSMCLSSFALGFMMLFPEQLIKMGLFFSVGFSLLIGVAGIMMGQMMMAAMGFLGFVFGLCYAYFVWGRIPFAAANMTTALTAVKANMGLAVVCYFFLAVAFGWTVWWSIAAGGAMNAFGSGGLFLFLVSYYWTHQVLQNTVHVTAAGVVGTWWFDPSEASSFCSPAIKDSFVRATTYSFGSICMGSLLVALVQALRHLLHHAREQDECQIVVCIIDCILSCIQGIIEELNRWAYVYVGLYGYSYLEAGKNVMTLFKSRGWTAIISEDLVDNVLFMISVGIGLISGLVGLVFAQMNQNAFGAMGFDSPGIVGFILGFLVGLVLASTLMSVVGAAVNTVIVCYAEAPNEFQTNHPELSNKMRSVWKQTWPAETAGY